MSADISLPRWAGTISEEVHWLDDILVDGDLTIAPEGKLVVYSHTRVRFAGTDRLQDGQDPSRCEVFVRGELHISSDRVGRANKDGGWGWLTPEPVVFEALMAGETWYGILPEESEDVQMLDGSWVLRDTEHGLLMPGAEFGSPTLDQSTAIFEEDAVQPAVFELLPNFPNPFNPETTIQYALPQASDVHLVVYNTLGQAVRILMEGFQPAGLQGVTWDGRDENGQKAASGVYLYQLEVAGQGRATRQMMLVR